MPKPPMNPHLDIRKQLDMLPPEHPYRHETFLTPLQAMVLPGLMWMFDQDTNKGQGRTYLLAVLIIELARLGNKVRVEDITASLLIRETTRADRYLLETIHMIMNSHYPKYKWQYDNINKTFWITGEKPR